MSRFFRGEYNGSDSDDSDASSSFYSDSDESYDSSSSSEMDFVAKKKAQQPTAESAKQKWGKAPVATKKSDDSDSDSDDSYFDQESSSSSDESDVEVKGLTGRNKWLKKSILEEKQLSLPKEETKMDTKKKQKQARQQQPSKSVAFEEDDINEDDEKSKSKQTTTAGGVKTVQITQESLYKQLDAVLEARGKKNTDKQLQVDTLRALFKSLAHTPYEKVRVLLAILPAQFDLAITSTFMAGDLWKDMAADVKDLLEIMEEHRQIIITEAIDEVENDFENEKKLKDGEKVYLMGNIGSFVERMDQEFTKSMQNIDPHSTEYIDRLKTETELYTLILRAQHYFEETKSKDALDLVIMCRIEHIYYKPLTLIQTLHEQVRKEYPNLAALMESSDPVDHLCKNLYKASHDRIRTRALLCHVYHHALHDRFTEGRDLLLMSHIQESIQHADIHTQILFNRSMVQLGLAAFRNGLVKECADSLHELFNSGKVRELLAQGVSTIGKTPEQEKAERARQMPFHMHINLELLECVYLTCSMLMEIPSMALHKHDYKKKVVAKTFKRLLDYHERQVFVAPPENVRDCIIAAAKYMLDGDWESAKDMVLSIKTWSLIRNSDGIKEMLVKKIKQESLITYVYSSLYCYKSLSIHFLAESFELDLKQVNKIISSLIASNAIPAKFESGHVVLIAPERPKLHSLILSYTEKLNLLVENNEKMLDVKVGTDDHHHHQSGGHHQHNNSSHHYQQHHHGGNSNHKNHRRKGKGPRKERA